MIHHQRVRKVSLEPSAAFGSAVNSGAPASLERFPASRRQSHSPSHLGGLIACNHLRSCWGTALYMPTKFVRAMSGAICLA